MSVITRFEDLIAWQEARKLTFPFAVSFIPVALRLKKMKGI